MWFVRTWARVASSAWMVPPYFFGAGLAPETAHQPPGSAAADRHITRFRGAQRKHTLTRCLLRASRRGDDLVSDTSYVYPPLTGVRVRLDGALTPLRRVLRVVFVVFRIGGHRGRDHRRRVTSRPSSRRRRRRRRRSRRPRASGRRPGRLANRRTRRRGARTRARTPAARSPRRPPRASPRRWGPSRGGGTARGEVASRPRHRVDRARAPTATRARRTRPNTGARRPRTWRAPSRTRARRQQQSSDAQAEEDEQQQPRRRRRARRRAPRHSKKTPSRRLKIPSRPPARRRARGRRAPSVRPATPAPPRRRRRGKSTRVGGKLRRCAAAALAAARAAEACGEVRRNRRWRSRDDTASRSLELAGHVGVVGGVRRRRQQERDAAAHFAHR